MFISNSDLLPGPNDATCRETNDPERVHQEKPGVQALGSRSRLPKASSSSTGVARSGDYFDIRLNAASLKKPVISGHPTADRDAQAIIFTDEEVHGSKD